MSTYPMAVNAGNSRAAVAMSGCCKHPGLSSSVVLHFLRAGVTARCRACSTAERTATNIVIAPIARAHHTAPCSSRLCSLLLTLVLPAPHACAPCSSCLCSPLLTRAPCSPCSSRSCSLCLQLPFRLWCCSRTFLSTMCARYSIFRLCFSALSLAPWTLPLLV